MREVDLAEWQTADPSTCPALHGLTLDEPRIAAAADRLRRADAVRVSEGRHGLVIEARQHVGVVRVGELRLRIRPKVQTRTLWSLLAYGLDLDEIPRHPPVDLELDGSVPDLLAAMLVIESDALWRAGLRRGYVSRDEWLGSPRGRPDLATLARHLPLTRAELPCRHQAFTADTLDNRVVLAALRFASRLTRAPRLRTELLRAEQQWSTACQGLPLTVAMVDAADRSRTRLTARYRSAHQLARALAARAGPDDELNVGDVSLHGALWNMATLFERAVARFLAEHLPSEYVVATQHRLHTLYSVEPGSHRHRAPDPRPDLVVSRATRPVAVLDTKYRDLSVTSLPREILYQMSVYSLAFGGAVPIPAVVLYAVPDGDRADVRIRLHVAGGGHRLVVLRAVPLDRLGALLSSSSGAARAGEALRLVAVS